VEPELERRKLSGGAVMGGQLWHLVVGRALEESADDQRSAQLFLLIAVLYPVSLAGGQPIVPSLIALVPDYALLLAIRRYWFVRGQRIGKQLVWLGLCIDLGFSVFFWVDPAFSRFDRGLALLQSILWLAFALSVQRVSRQNR